MSTNEYHFLTHWRVEGTREEVFEILEDVPSVMRWWPSVYLDVRVREPGDERGIGKVVSFYTKGWLPYTLRWQCRVTEKSRPERLALEAWGDFDGRGVWTFAQDGRFVACTYEWRVRAGKPLLRYLSFLVRPIFAANHRWAMARGEESLKLELRRRHAATSDERARVPVPPGPTSSVPLLLAAAGVLALAAGLVWALVIR